MSMCTLTPRCCVCRRTRGSTHTAALSARTTLLCPRTMILRKKPKMLLLRKQLAARHKEYMLKYRSWLQGAHRVAHPLECFLVQAHTRHRHRHCANVSLLQQVHQLATWGTGQHQELELKSVLHVLGQTRRAKMRTRHCPMVALVDSLHLNTLPSFLEVRLECSAGCRAMVTRWSQRQL
jgi:hypothetical protein